MIKYVKPGDICIILFLMCLSLITWRSFRKAAEGRTAIVYCDGNEAGVLDLNEEQQFNVRGPMGESRLQVTGGTIQMVSSPCPHQICVKTGKIFRSKSMIVCVPNRILVRISGNDTDSLDAITQ